MSEGDPDLAFSPSPSDDCSGLSSTPSDSVSPNVAAEEANFLVSTSSSSRTKHRTKVSITMDPVMAGADQGDTEAGPDVAEEEEFRSASEVFKDPNAFDFLSQHGTSSSGSGSGGGGGGLHLARESLYVKFDPLVGGRPSVMQRVRREDEEADADGAGRKDSDPLPGSDDQKDLMALQSPSPKKPSAREDDDNSDGATNKTPVRKKPSDASPKTLGPQQHLEFQEQLLRKEAQIAELERVVQEKFSIIERLKTEVAKRRESEEQMKQVHKKTLVLDSFLG